MSFEKTISSSDDVLKAKIDAVRQRFIHSTKLDFSDKDISWLIETCAKLERVAHYAWLLVPTCMATIIQTEDKDTAEYLNCSELKNLNKALNDIGDLYTDDN